MKAAPSPQRPVTTLRTERSKMAEKGSKRKRSAPDVRRPGTVLFFSLSADDDARTLSNFCEVPGKLAIPGDFEVEGLRNKSFPSVENAFQAAKYARYAEPTYLSYLSADPKQGSLDRSASRSKERSIDELADKLTPRQARTFGGKAGMRENNLELSLKPWEEASPGIMEALIRLRHRQDAAFEVAIEKFAREGKKFYHFERSGSKSFWGGHFPRDGGPWAGGNRLGEIMNKIAGELAIQRGF